MPHVCGLNCFYFKNRQELVLAEFEEGITFAAVEFFEIEDILVERDRLVDVINLDRDVIASIHLHAHFLIYFCRTRTQKVRSTWMLPQKIDCFWQRPFCSLPRCPLRPNALGVAGSSAAGVRLFSQPLQCFDDFPASSTNLLSVDGSQLFDQLVTLVRELEKSAAPIAPD